MNTGGWFRMYDTVLDDPKVQMLSAEDFRSWVNLLCLAKRHDGKLPRIVDIAFALRMTVEGATTVVERLANGGLIDRASGGMDGWHYAPHGWDKRQFKSDTSTERVKRFRNKIGTGPETETETEKKEAQEVPSPLLSSEDKSSSDSLPAAGQEAEFVLEAVPEKTKPKPRPGGEWPRTAFADWYKVYPRPRAPDDAKRAFEKVQKSGVTFDGLMAATKALVAEGREKKFTPYPASWLNSGEWKDASAAFDVVQGTAKGLDEPVEHLPTEHPLALAFAARYRKLKKQDPPKDEEGFLLPVSWVREAEQIARSAA